MLGLIKKDFLIIKNNLKLIIVMLMVFFIMALGGQFNISFIPTFIIVMLFISTFSYDEYNNWDAYAITLPGGRKSIVKSKYIASLFLTLLSAVITVLLNCLISVINNTDVNEFISSLLGSICAIVIIQSIMYPLIFKFGMEKGRIVLFILVFVMVGVISLLKNIIKTPNILVVLFNDYWFIVIPIILVISLLISYKISEKIYLKKEF